MNYKKSLPAAIALLVAGIAFQSCSKDQGNTARVDVNYDLNNKAKLQVINTTLNTSKTYVFMDGEPLSGTPLAYSSGATNTGSGLTYAVDPGLHAFNVRDIASAVQPPLAFSEDFQANTQYTIFLYDTMNAIKQKTVAANIVRPTNGEAKVRFANLAWQKNATAPSVDIFSKNLNANIASDVPYSEITEFALVPNPGVTDSIYVREAGTTTTLGSGAFTFLPNEHYTVVYRGSYSATTTFARSLAAYISF